MYPRFHRVIPSKPIAYLLSLTRRSGCKGKGFFAFHPNFFLKFFGPFFQFHNRRQLRPLLPPFSKNYPALFLQRGAKVTVFFHSLQIFFQKLFQPPPTPLPPQRSNPASQQPLFSSAGRKDKGAYATPPNLFLKKENCFWEKSGKELPFCGAVNLRCSSKLTKRKADNSENYPL